MKGAEGLETRPVHVLRHRFEMSSHLSQKTIKILKLRSGAFQIFGTKRIALEATDFYQHRHDLQIFGIRENFWEYDQPILANGAVRGRETSHGRVQLAFQVQRQQQFDHLLSGLDALPNLLPNKATSGHYLVVDIAANALLQSRAETIDAIPQLSDAVREPSQSPLYSFGPLDITGYDDVMRLPLRTEPNTWQDAS